MKHSIRMFALLVGMLLISSAIPTIASATPLAWTVSHVEESSISGVSCPSTSLCVAVDNSGNVLTSTNPTGGAGAWTVSHVVSNRYLSDISCPSASLCVATDYDGGNVLTSTNPTGGAGAWTVAHVDEYIKAVSCPSVSLCVAVGGSLTGVVGGEQQSDVVTSTNPAGGAGAWTVTHVGKTIIRGVSCPSTSMCVAVGDNPSGGGDVATSTNPTGGAGAWTVAHVGSSLYGEYMLGVSCPSASLCVAVGTEGHVVTSTNPTGGAGAWTIANLSGGYHLQDISCPSVSLCVAVDLDGNIVTSTNPTGGAAAWTATSVDSGTEFNAVSCPSTSLCVAGDSSGNVVVGTPATLPVNTGLPVISGTAQVGQTLSCSPGGWSGSLPQTYTYQWKRDGVDIGATGTTYLISAADQGHTLTCAVTAHNAAGASAPATSAPTGTVQAEPASGGSPGGGAVQPAAVVTPPPAVPVVAQCLVPKLKGKTLAQAKKLLTRSHCKLGKVSTQKSTQPKVISQKPGPGKKLPAGSKIAIKLG